MFLHIYVLVSCLLRMVIFVFPRAVCCLRVVSGFCVDIVLNNTICAVSREQRVTQLSPGDSLERRLIFFVRISGAAAVCT